MFSDEDACAAWLIDMRWPDGFVCPECGHNKVGMLMDDVSGVLIASPLLLPIVRDLGVDPIQFAAIIGVNLGMGNITLPTAPLLYLGARIGNTSVNSMLKPTLLMIVFAWIPTLLLTTYTPKVAL